MNGRLATAAVAALLVLSTFCAIPGVVSAQQASGESGQVIGRPDLSFATSAGELSPGTASELSIAVTNQGSITRGGPEAYENRVTTARGLTMRAKDGNVPLTVQTGQLSVGNLPSGSVDVGPVPVTVAEDAEPGTYRVPIEYEYQYTSIVTYGSGSVEYRDSTRSETGEMVVEVRDEPQFDVLSRDSDAQVGDSGDVTVTLRNVGSETARDASVTAASDSGALTFDAGAASSSAAVGDWEPGENRTVTYSVSVSSDATERTFTTDLTVAYSDAEGIEQTSNPLSLGISAAGEQSFSFSDVTSTLRVGEEGTVSGTITNTGPQTAENVVVQYADDASTLVPVEQSAAVGTLEPGADASFSLPIEVVSEARAGAKSLSFAAQYRNQDGDRRRYENLEVVADVAAERDQFGISLANRTISAGDTRTVTVEATNNLEETVTDVEARLFADDPLDAGDDNEGFVESIEPGETVTLTYELSAASSATPGKTYPISFDFRYDDERGNSHLSNTVRVAVDVTEAESGGLPLGMVALVGVALVGIGVVVRYRRN